MSELRATIEGFVARDPEFKTLPNGAPVVEFSIAHTPQKKVNGEYVNTGDTVWCRVNDFDGVGKGLNIVKGSIVRVEGRLRVRAYMPNLTDRQTGEVTSAAGPVAALDFAATTIVVVSRQHEPGTIASTVAETAPAPGEAHGAPVAAGAGLPF